MACGRKACEKEPMDGRYYCSKTCARLDVDSDEESDTPSDPVPEQSSTKGDGEPSIPSSIDEDKTESDPEEESEPQSDELSTEATTRSTESESPTDTGSYASSEHRIKSAQSLREDLIISGKIKPNTERSGMPGMQETERSTAETKSTGGLPATQVARSGDIVRSLDVERSATMSLIDESASVLLDCMRTANKRSQGQDLMDFRQVNAIANVGKQIAQMAKVKLDAIKEARK